MQSTLVHPSENFASPPVVYFWGPVRAHVNRVATEYASKIGAGPVRLDVRLPRDGADHPLEANAIPGPRVFELTPGKDGQFVAAPSDGPAPNRPKGPHPRETEDTVRVVLKFPPVVRAALSTASSSGPTGAFILSNIDRLQPFSSTDGYGLVNALSGAFRERGVVLVLTSEGLLPIPQMAGECGFEVVSLPEEEWWEAEVRAGVPFSNCLACPGSVSGAYGTCDPKNPAACPVLAQFTETAVPGSPYAEHDPNPLWQDPNSNGFSSPVGP